MTEIHLKKQYWYVSMLSLQKEGLICQTSQESIKVCNFGIAADYSFINEDDIKSYIASSTY